MTRRKQPQQTLWEGIVAEDVKSLWESWMVEADRLLEDEELIDFVYEAQGERHENSRTKGRSQTPAEMALRLLLLKHVRNWSYDRLECEVRANLAYRDFCRIGLGKVPDAKTLARIGQAISGDVIADLHGRLVELAKERGVVKGRKMRVDTTVVETNIHYPTDAVGQAGRWRAKPDAQREQAPDSNCVVCSAQRCRGRGTAQEALSDVVAPNAADPE